MVLHSLSCLGFFWSFFGGDAKSLAWVFLPRRLLPFVFGFFFLPFLGAMPNPSLGCSCSSGAAFRVCVVFFLLFGGRCQIPRLGASCSMSSKSPSVLGFKSPTDMRAASIIIYYLDWRDSSWWTWIGQTAIWGNGMGISTKWFFQFCLISLWPFYELYFATSTKWFLWFWNIFLTSLLNDFIQKTTFDIIWLTYPFYLSTKCGSWV